MYSCTQLLASLKSGSCDKRLSTLYALDGAQSSLDAARQRAMSLVETFQNTFSAESGAVLFSGPGRTEIGGNHTDHQHGHVLCASVDMDMLACAAPNGLNIVHIQSDGYPVIEVSLDDLAIKPEEQNSSAALVRGVAAKLTELGYQLSGFDACIHSTVLSGSGLSSSAAYEVLMGNIFSYFCCGNTLDAITIAKVGQYAENVYFGKPCGLMDQMGSSIGGAVAIDFANPANPSVERADYDFSKSGHALCIVDTASSHGDLTNDYAEITQEMAAIAGYFGQKFLRDVAETDFWAAIPDLRAKFGDRAVLRAMHYYDDDRRAVNEAEALKSGDFNRFLTLVNESGRSSAVMLQNTWSISDPRQQAVPLALAVGEKLLGGAGAIRVHGGGFAGTIQAFVPNDKLNQFKTGMEAILGSGRCHILHIRPQGGCVVIDG